MSIEEKDNFYLECKERMLAANPFASKLSLAYSAIEEAILTARLLPGEKITITAIAEKMDISATPVKDALELLAEKKRVTAETPEDGKHKVYRVSVFSKQEIEDLYLARTTLEVAAIEWCAKHPWQVDTDRLSELAEEYLKRWKAYYDNSTIPSPTENGKLDREFHTIIVASTKNQILINAYDAIEETLSYMSAIVGNAVFEESMDDILAIANQHVFMVDAIKRGLAGPAMDLMRAHMDLCEEFARSYFLHR